MIYTLAGALPMASAVILIPFYLLYLPAETYGALALCLAYSVLIQVIVTYSFDTSIYIYYHELKNEPKKLASFISSSFLFMLGLGFAVGLILSIVGQFLFTIILPKSTISFYPYGLISTGVGIFQAIFKVHANLLQTREKPQTFLWSNVISFGIIAISTIVGLKLFPETLVGPLGGRLLAGLLATTWVLYRIFKEFGIHFTSPWQQTSASFNAYTFVYQIQQWSFNYADRFILGLFMPLASVGIYDFAVKCLVPIELLLNGLNATINPKIVKLITLQNEKGSTIEINRYFYGLISVIMLAVCVSILGIPVLGDLLIHDSRYSEALHYLPYLALIYIFKAIRLYFVVPYSVLKKMRRLTTLNFSIAVLKIVLMVLMIQRWGLYGVIISSMIAYAGEALLLWYYLKEDYIMKFNAFKLLISPIALLLIILISELWFGQDFSLYLHILYLLTCVLLLWLAYQNELKLFYTMKLKQ